MKIVSVIIPVFNVAEYLRSAIDSVVSQSIGFDDNIEVILVDDGSTDDSPNICEDYVNRYPKNIKYIRQKNSGVSVARNTGKAHAKGKYIHFLDGDDMVSQNFYTESTKFLEANQQAEFVASKIKFFEGVIDSHPLNDKFYADRVIDIVNDPSNPLLHVTTCVFRRDAVEAVSFDDRLRISEDIKFISDVLLRKKKYGVVEKPVYYYRKRIGGSSAIDGKEKNTDYYDTVPECCYEYVLSSWRSHDGSVQWADYVLLYELAYRLKQKHQTILSNEEQELYKEKIKSLINSLNTEAIVSNRFLDVYQKLYALEVKFGDEYKNHLKTQEGVTYFKGFKLYDHRNTSVFLDFLTKEKDKQYLFEGYIDGPFSMDKASFCLRVGDVDHELSYVPRFQREHSFLGDVYCSGGAFEAQVEVPLRSSLSVVLKAPGVESAARLTTGPFTRFGALKLTYRRDKDRLIKRLGRSLESYPYSLQRHALLELRMLMQIALNWRLSTAKLQLEKLRSRNLAQLSLKARVFEAMKPMLFVAEAVYMIPRALVLRSAYYIGKNNLKRPIWIISDRGMAAGDNGEALFRYIMRQADRPADVYFVISKKSKEYNRLRAVGPVLDQDSLRYKFKFLLAEKIISSHADIETTNPFIRQMDHYVDLFNFDFVFLQHGIIRHDLSGWLNRFNKNIKMFVTSAKKEYDSIFHYPYYYSDKEVCLTGLPRYDHLESDPARKLILAPTYRKRVARMKTNRNGMRPYDELFKESDYFKFYSAFMSDQRILSALKKYNMTGELYLHPVFAPQVLDFHSSEQFKVMDFPYDYKKAFREGELLVSDHSSVMFDFAYLKKPILYAHFDVDTFFEGHLYQKSVFFTDEEDGFGTVCYDYEALVKAVTDTISGGCTMSDEYKSRVDRFFYKVDKNNSERVYEAILNINK